MAGKTSLTDARNGTSSNSFNNADQIVTATTPVPGSGMNAQTTTNFYDTVGRLIGMSLPDGGAVTNFYFGSGELKKTSGTRTYPVQYNYDAQGRLTGMTNWTNFVSVSGARATSWAYDATSGFLTNKVYADGDGTGYSNTLSGRIKMRTWARGTTATYSYNAAGDMTATAYSDGTAGITNGYDRRGAFDRHHQWHDGHDPDVSGRRRVVGRILCGRPVGRIAGDQWV